MFSKIQSVIIILILLFYTSPLHAFSICPHKWFILPGLGLSVFNGTFMTGGEISATFSKDCIWYGIYGDIQTDFDQAYKKAQAQNQVLVLLVQISVFSHMKIKTILNMVFELDLSCLLLMLQFIWGQVLTLIHRILFQIQGFSLNYRFVKVKYIYIN